MLFILILILLLLIILFVLFSFYYYKLINRFFSFIKKEKVLKKNNKLFILFSIILTLLSFNLFNISGLFFMYFIFISLIIDLIYLCLKKVIKNKRFISLYNSLLLPFVITILVLIYGMFNIRNVVETKYNIESDKDINNTKILFIADSHYGKVFKKDDLLKVKKKLDSVDADIVIIGGDVVDEGTSKEEMEFLFEVFGDIKNKDGIYFVYGNHDRQTYSNKRKYNENDIAKSLDENNIKVLKDNYYRIDDNFIIAGREDFSYGREKLSDVLKDVDKDDYIIMVDHQPLDYDENVDNNVDLIVSGHTHGGQIFPVEVFIKLFHTADLSYGYKNYNGMDAIVTSGLVGWGFPVRTSRNSEYVVINIK